MGEPFREGLAGDDTVVSVRTGDRGTWMFKLAGRLGDVGGERRIERGE